MKNTSKALVEFFNMAGFFYPPARIQAMMIQSQAFERYAYELFHSAKMLIEGPTTQEGMKLRLAVMAINGNPYDPIARARICEESKKALAKAGWDTESDAPYMQVLKIAGKKYFDEIAAPVFMTTYQPQQCGIA